MKKPKNQHMLIDWNISF